ncbi:MAG: PQQ-binding-like beta-propeller repeat protein [Planctomycetaceae bacterium]
MHRHFVSLPTLLMAMMVGVSGQAQRLDPSELSVLKLEVRWQSQAVMNVDRDVVRHISNDESNVYVQSSAGMLTTLDAENGRKLWNQQVGRRDEPALGAVSNSRMVVVVSGPVIFAFEKFRGTPLFAFRMPAQPTAAPAINEGALFIPVTGGSLWAYSLSVLEFEFRYGKLPETHAKPNEWKFVCGEEIRHPPVLGERAVCFATEAKNLYAVEITGVNRGRTRAQLVLNESVSSDLTAADNSTDTSVILATKDNRVFSVDIMTANTEWTYPMGRAVRQAPIVIGSHVFVVTQNGTLTKLERDKASTEWGRPVETPRYAAPLYIGAGLEETAIDADVKDRLGLASDQGLIVRNVGQGSPAAAAGVREGDILVQADGRDLASVDDARSAFSELPVRVSRPLVVIRDGAKQKLPLKIETQEWSVQGIQSLNSVGRFAVYGTDQTNRLTAVDRLTGTPLGTMQIQGFGVPHHNSLTDQIYLTSKSGEVVCIREIGPEVVLPELSVAAPWAKIREFKVKVGDPIEATGTVVCEVELPDGSVQEITSSEKGIVRTLYSHAETDGVVTVGAPLALIADDRFATYHRSPEQRPIDVPLSDPNAVP